MENQELAKALAKAQKEVKELEKSATSKVRLKSGGEYSFDYVPLESVLDEARRVLASNGISFQQHITRDDKGLCLFTELLHESGQSKVIPTPVIGNPTNMQEMGSLFTYAKRYAMLGILGIAGSDDIDANDTNEKNESFTVTQKDKVMQNTNNYAAKQEAPKTPLSAPFTRSANQAAPSQAKASKLVTEAQVKRLYAIHEKAGWSFENVTKKMKELFNKMDVSQLNMTEYDELISFIQLTKPDSDSIPF